MQACGAAACLSIDTFSVVPFVPPSLLSSLHDGSCRRASHPQNTLSPADAASTGCLTPWHSWLFQVCCLGYIVTRCAVLCCAVLCCAVLCCAVLCCVVLCCVVLCVVQESVLVQLSGCQSELAAAQDQLAATAQELRHTQRQVDHQCIRQQYNPYQYLPSRQWNSTATGWGSVSSGAAGRVSSGTPARLKGRGVLARKHSKPRSVVRGSRTACCPRTR
jgi:hypothetical protein